MKKAEIKRIPNNELIREYIKAYSQFQLNCNLGRGTTQLGKQLAVFEDELAQREILTPEDIYNLQS